MLKTSLQANLAVFTAIMFIKFICWANPDMQEPFNYWWIMLVINIILVIGFILVKLEQRRLEKTKGE